MTIRLVSCMNVSYSGDMDYHDYKIGICMNVRFCSHLDHQCKLLL